MSASNAFETALLNLKKGKVTTAFAKTSLISVATPMAAVQIGVAIARGVTIDTVVTSRGAGAVSLTRFATSYTEAA